MGGRARARVHDRELDAAALLKSAYFHAMQSELAAEIDRWLAARP